MFIKLVPRCKFLFVFNEELKWYRFQVKNVTTKNFIFYILG